MKHLLSVIALISVLAFGGCCVTHKTLSLKPQSFEQELKKDNGLLIDVRTPAEYAEGHLAGATVINFQDSSFAAQVSRLDKDKPVYLYCKSGKRSAAARATMAKQGFKKIVHMKGGITEWQNAGMPVER